MRPEPGDCLKPLRRLHGISLGRRLRGAMKCSASCESASNSPVECASTWQPSARTVQHQCQWRQWSDLAVAAVHCQERAPGKELKTGARSAGISPELGSIGGLWRPTAPLQRSLVVPRFVGSLPGVLADSTLENLEARRIELEASGHSFALWIPGASDGKDCVLEEIRLGSVAEFGAAVSGCLTHRERGRRSALANRTIEPRAGPSRLSR